MRLKYKNTTLYKDYITLYNMDHNRLRINSCKNTSAIQDMFTEEAIWLYH